MNFKINTITGKIFPEVIFWVLFFFPVISVAQVSPLETACKVADKVLNDVRFYYNMKLAADRDYGSVQTIDFSRNYPQEGCAYALSSVEVPKDTTIDLTIVNYGDCRIILNGKTVWSHPGMHLDDFQYIERDFTLKGKATLPLRAGINKILIKSKAPADGVWKVHLKPGRILFSLKGFKEIEESLSGISKWLIIGTFPDDSFTNQELVEREFVTGKMYRTSDNREITWMIPRLEIVAANAEIHQPWNEGYTAFNYHAGGLAMAMEILGQYTGQEKYTNYCRTYCDFYVEKRDYMVYQKFRLNAFNAWDNKVVKGFLLDYTSAPMLPYAEVLLNTIPVERDPMYMDFFNEMKDYVVNIQTRTPEGNFNRINPRKYTVWVDDMYMGLPFLVQAARLSNDPKERENLIDDAINQVFAFNQYVWNPETNLYRHGQFTETPVNMPHWSRGNGWGLWAVTNLLAHLPKDHPQYKKLLAHYRNHIEGLIKYQDKSGLWRNVLDHSGSYLETSGTAIFTVCMIRGIRNGWLSAKKYTPIVIQAWKGIESMIGTESEVHGITIGTNCTTDINYYLERETCINDDHGLFPVIIAAVELDKLLNRKK